MAEIFADLCTLNGSLIQGTSTSPVLANLVCKKLDESLTVLATQYNCTYSRYADDITFSGDKIPRKKEIEKCLKDNGFVLNQDKYKSQLRGRSQYVTGLTVVDKTKPRISKNLKRRLRQIMYYASKYGLNNHLEKIKCTDINTEIRRLDGLVAFMYSVEPEVALELDTKWQEILSKALDRVVARREPYIIFQRLSNKSNTLKH